MFKSVIAIVLGVAFLFAPVKDEPKGHWENGDCYVYYTEEEAVFEGVDTGVAYVCVTETGDEYGAYVYDTDLIEGDVVTLTFENRETRQEYVEAEEYGIESVTRVDNARIVAID